MSCGKTAYIVLLVLLVFSFTGSAQVQEEPTICPIVALDNAGGADLTAYLLGGWSKNGWLDDHGTSSLLRGGERYRF